MFLSAVPRPARPGTGVAAVHPGPETGTPVVEFPWEAAKTHAARITGSPTATAIRADHLNLIMLHLP
jgi:hypothetical protein